MDPSQSGTGSARQGEGDSSAPSPTDTRHPVIRTDSGSSRDNLGFSESFQSTETVRHRPEGGYGSIQSPGQSSAAQFSGDYLQARPGSRSSMATPQIRSPRLASRSKSYNRLRKPPMSRRPSSNAPHRGDFFSVDDDVNEVEADAFGRSRDYTPGGNSTRRRQNPPTSLSRMHSRRDDEEEGEQEQEGDLHESQGQLQPQPNEELEQAESPAEREEEVEEEVEEEEEEDDGDADSSSDVSEAESFTLKDRQAAINQTHPFGIRVWKPALYKKDRSIQKSAQADIHSSPGGNVNSWLLLFNLIWTLLFGWWLACFAASAAIVCLLFSAAPSGQEYGRILWGLSGYLFYPFGKFVRLEKDDAYRDEDQDEGRSISEYEQWQSGDLEYGRLFFGPDRNRSIIGRSRRSIDSGPSESESLLGRRGRGDVEDDDSPRGKRRLFGRGQWNIGRIIFFTFFYFLISPALILVSAICWFLVFWIPMGKVTILLFDHLRRHPLAMSFESDIRNARADDAPNSSILLCTYRAVGSKYWKYTVDGTNIFLINLMAVVIFVIADWLILDRILHLENALTAPAFLFTAGLLSIIPLAYFIGQAVASISAQSSMGVGAAVNAFFATVVEVFLYCVALTQGKGQLVEGSIIGSVFAGILFLPGISMCFGAIKRKTQRFNAKSAGVTSTMLLFAVVCAFGPTLFYQIYGTHELNCLDCTDFQGGLFGHGEGADCRRCYFDQVPALDDRFYLEAVRPYSYFAACLLFFAYLIGLWFTLRTHAAVIWNVDEGEKRHDEHMQSSIIRSSQGHSVSQGYSVAETTGTDIRESPMYKRILGQSLKQVGLQPRPGEFSRQGSVNGTSQEASGANGAPPTPHVVPPKPENLRANLQHMSGLSEAESNVLVREVAEIAATAATIAHRDKLTRKISSARPGNTASSVSKAHTRPAAIREGEEDGAGLDGGVAAQVGGADGGHDAPNWSRVKSTVILLAATVLYAIIAEILVDTVDVVLESFSIDQKFLGITLFALVPNTTEFLNAISFAMNGNIALSMEIGSAYALQVCLLQIPALVLFSAVYTGIPEGVDAANYTFSLLFPQWDMVTVILCVFLLSYMYGEGKSNYFKGSILLLTYLVMIVGYYFTGYTADVMGPERFDVMGTDGSHRSFKTIGRSTSGRAY